MTQRSHNFYGWQHLEEAIRILVTQDAPLQHRLTTAWEHHLYKLNQGIHLPPELWADFQQLRHQAGLDSDRSLAAVFAGMSPDELTQMANRLFGLRSVLNASCQCE